MMASRMERILSLDKNFNILIEKVLIQICVMVLLLVLHMIFNHTITCMLLVIEGLHTMYTVIQIEKVDKKLGQEFEGIYNRICG